MAKILFVFPIIKGNDVYGPTYADVYSDIDLGIKVKVFTHTNITHVNGTRQAIRDAYNSDNIDYAVFPCDMSTIHIARYEHIPYEVILPKARLMGKYVDYCRKIKVPYEFIDRLKHDWFYIIRNLKHDKHAVKVHTLNRFEDTFYSWLIKNH